MPFTKPAPEGPEDRVFKVATVLYFVVLIIVMIGRVQIGDMDLASPAGAAMLFLFTIGGTIVVLALRDRQPWLTVVGGAVMAIPAVAAWLLTEGGPAATVGAVIAIVVCFGLGFAQRSFK